MKTKRLKEIYKDMLAKCYDPKHPEYKNVGAKGITVCDEWYTPGSRRGWKNFKKWAISIGYYE